MASLTLNFEAGVYTLSDSGRWSGPDPENRTRFKDAANRFFADEYGPEHGPPMNALARWLPSEAPGVVAVKIEDDDYDPQTVF